MPILVPYSGIKLERRAIDRNIFIAHYWLIHDRFYADDDEWRC
jgi:hypothetical protein